MKRIIASVLAISAVAAAAPAFAQPRPYGDRDRDGVPNAYDTRNNNYRGYGQWQSINSRQANLDRRIDVGVRNGSLTRSEAVRLRAEFRNIAYLESRYRRSNGLSNWERQDLDRRFDRLSQRIRVERHDRQDYRGYRRY
jgi:hypothetical protein